MKNETLGSTQMDLRGLYRHNNFYFVSIKIFVVTSSSFHLNSVVFHPRQTRLNQTFRTLSLRKTYDHLNSSTKKYSIGESFLFIINSVKSL